MSTPFREFGSRSKTRSSAPAEDPAAERALDLAQSRIAIEGIETEIDGGRFPAKAVLGKPFDVEADVFSDGHDTIAAALVQDPAADGTGAETLMSPLGNDRWRGVLTFTEPGLQRYGVIAWRDLFATWIKDTQKKIAAGVKVSLETEEGRRLVAAAVEDRSARTSQDSADLAALAKRLDAAHEAERLEVLLSDGTQALMRRAGPRTNLTRYPQTLEVFVDRPAAAFSAWYEMMPRSQSGSTDRHGTFDDVIAQLPYVRYLGFDVLYFTPIHPIGKTNRKGRNNSLTPGPDDPGSPYAIGSEDGGHDAIHPELGTIEDFDRLVEAAAEHDLEIALDFAIQCSPDHPWIKEHPEWFDWRPDGTIKFAENPPKKYEDIVNVHFYRDALPDLWLALRDVVLFWVAHGVKIFRVDNPHTKPFPFWEWMISEVRSKHPDVIFLAEAFTRPKVMKRLAKVGFSQSYSYFTWRNEKEELTEYLEELTTEQCRHYMRPNFFANTPDINPVYLQESGRPGFRIRLVLAATLAGNYGLYNGFEICDAAPVPGKEEYLNSEKYEIRQWDMDAPGHIKDDIRLVNRLRRERPAMQGFDNLTFYNAFDDEVLYYGKHDPETGDFVLVHVNLNPHEIRNFEFEVPLWEFGLPDDASIEVQDLRHGNHFTWHGKSHWLTLDPDDCPYAIWRLIPPGAGRE
ncbi:alpha-1,4-glucan--maltose-1-phosphate maltosyltransferase [Amorphus orientalis]|uniref:Alpha-1,4-glucan:maltose-1-phosphate maltosyltransferase n=1 Tax=Amorphus orientalis TaxID=649198 RepID=A0AAE3VRG2_9HYPH|nr:alpha-1,4-glucan--maltose-1-phosphate maltosyltransferase [Amorphus orientalis]MDQ0316480.1 starch synthase (maltosyl-transferring) [Amorphus orientalis]